VVDQVNQAKQEQLSQVTQALPPAAEEEVLAVVVEVT
jgi:hypothetical protein